MVPLIQGMQNYLFHNFLKHNQNLLLNEMLRLSENLTGIELRKKYGAKQS